MAGHGRSQTLSVVVDGHEKLSAAARDVGGGGWKALEESEGENGGSGSSRSRLGEFHCDPALISQLILTLCVLLP